MPIGTSDGRYFEDEFDFFTNNGKEVINPKDAMPPNTDSKMEVLDPQMIQPDVLDTMRELEVSAQRRSQDASVGPTEPRTDVLQGPEVSGYTPDDLNAPATGLRDMVREGARAIRDATGIGKESYVEDFLTKFKNSKDLLDLYFEGKIEPNDPNLVNAVTTLATTAGSVGLASAPLRTSSVGTFGGTLGLKTLLNTAGKEPKELEGFASAVAKTKEGASSTDIWNKTGWWKDSRDGMWKFEIPDKDASFKEIDSSKLVEFGWEWKPEKNNWDTYGGVNLSDIIDHPALFKAYPELKNLKVVQSTTTKDYIAGLLPPLKDKETGITSSPRIELYDGFFKQNDEEKMRTFLHEIQHWIQWKENFGRSKNSRQGLDETYWSSPGEIESRNVEMRYSRALRLNEKTPPPPNMTEHLTGYYY